MEGIIIKIISTKFFPMFPFIVISTCVVPIEVLSISGFKFKIFTGLLFNISSNYFPLSSMNGLFHKGLCALESMHNSSYLIIVGSTLKIGAKIFNTFNSVGLQYIEYALKVSKFV